MRLSGNIKVKIPAGVDTGSRLRVHGEGEAGERGARRGDLYLVIHVRPHEIFERHEADILDGDMEDPNDDFRLPSGENTC